MTANIMDLPLYTQLLVLPPIVLVLLSQVDTTNILFQKFYTEMLVEHKLLYILSGQNKELKHLVEIN